MSMHEAGSVPKSVDRVVFGPVTVFLGEKNGKYPDANQVIVTGADVRAALDAPLACLDSALEVLAAPPGPPDPARA